jgi:hypothetical protein
MQYTSSETHAAFLLPVCPIHGKTLCWHVAQADPLSHFQTYDALRHTMPVIPTAVLLYTSMCCNAAKIASVMQLATAAKYCDLRYTP